MKNITATYEDALAFAALADTLKSTYGVNDAHLMGVAISLNLPYRKHKTVVVATVGTREEAEELANEIKQTYGDIIADAYPMWMREWREASRNNIAFQR